MDMEVMSPRSVARRVKWARVHAALGDPTRLAVVEVLHHDDVSPQELARRLGIAPNLLSHHVRVLEAAGIVRRVVSEGDRRRSYVQAVPGSFDGMWSPGATLPNPERTFAVEPRTWLVPRVLFVCTRNSARSVLAAALWSRASSVPVASAGTEPAPEVHPMALRAATRHGLALTSEARGNAPLLGRPRHVNDVARPGDLVVSTCDAVREEMMCGAHPIIHWSVADPVRIGTESAFDLAVQDLTWRVERLAAVVAVEPRGVVTG
jgi:protein-tyrosine-phosphatase/DNA-binding transcriptional ArsR family regulator